MGSTGRHIALLGAVFVLTDIDGSNITWLEPPPLKTVKVASRISRTTKQVTKGSLNEELSCKFNLSPDLYLISVWMEVRNVSTVTFVPNVSLSVPKGIAKSLNATWVPNKLTLTFYKVTAAEKGKYSCNVVTNGSRPQTWTRKIQLLVADSIQEKVSAVTASKGQSQIMVSSITVSLNPSQAMTPSITVSHGPIPTTDYSTTGSGVDNQWTAIGLGVGVVVFVIIAILIAIRCYLKWRERSQIRDGDQQGRQGIPMRVPAGDALPGPPAADGINGSQSGTNIPG